MPLHGLGVQVRRRRCKQTIGYVRAARRVQGRRTRAAPAAAARRLAGDDLIHQVQPGEGVLGVEQRTLVLGSKVMLHVFPRQRRSAKDHRGIDPPLVEHLQVFAHHHRRLDQQSGHADGVGFVLLVGLDDGADGLLDPQVVDHVSVVGEDDVHEVFADVVYVAANGGEDDGTLAAVRLLVHVRFEERHRGLHGLG